jgi:hypothetical protein
MNSVCDRRFDRERERFAPGSRYEALRAADVAQVVRRAIFEAALRSVTLHVALEADLLHLAVTVVDAEPDTRPRPPYDD